MQIQFILSIFFFDNLSSFLNSTFNDLTFCSAENFLNIILVDFMIIPLSSFLVSYLLLVRLLPADAKVTWNVL